MQKALRALSREGLVETRSGAGSFVLAARLPRPADYGWQTAAMRSPHRRLPTIASPLRPPSADAIALHSGYPDPELLPERLVRAAIARSGRSASALERSPTAGIPQLRGWFASELARTAAPAVGSPTMTDVIVTPGSQSGLSSIFRAIVGAGRPLIVESPTYWGAILAAAQTGVDLVPVPDGPDGPDPDELDRAFRESGARAFYAQPNFANPTGARWDEERSRGVLDVVRAHSAFLVEDDWAHDFGIDAESRPLASFDDAGHVVYLRSLSKSVSPAVRVAAIIARGPARERILADCSTESMYVSDLLQAVALEVVTRPGWQAHRRSLRGRLRDRRDLLVESIRTHAREAHITGIPSGGLNLWAQVDDRVDLTRLVRDCESAGVLISAGDDWFPAEPPGRFVRLNFSGPDMHRFPDAARAIGRALDEQS